MFDIFRKKSQIKKLIETDGIEHATDRFAEIISRKLTSSEIVYQFILEELDGASGGNDASMQFAESSGFLPEEYGGALKNSNSEVDGPDGPQQLLLALSLELLPNLELVAKFRCMIVQKIMQKFKLGRYAQREERIDNLLGTLKNILITDSNVIPAFTSNIPVPSSAQVKHISNQQKNISAAKNIILILSTMTGDNSETIIKNALFSNKKSYLKGGMRIENARVDILFITQNNNVIYINDEIDHLFISDKDGDEKIDGRVVNFVLSGQGNHDLIEIFVAFNDSDSYMMFTLKEGRDERLNYIAQEIFKFLSGRIKNLFSRVESYSTQYIYTFKLYRNRERYFMINNAQTKAYLIDNYGIKRDDVDEIKKYFWGDFK